MRSSQPGTAPELARRDVVYKGVRVFVKAFREQLANNRLQVSWDDPPQRDEKVRLGIEPPYMGKVFDIDATVVFVGAGFVGLELVPLNSRQRYELESHARMCELVKQDFVAAIRSRMAQMDEERRPVGLPTQRSRVPAREDLVCLDVEVGGVVEFMEVYKLQLNWRDLLIRMPQPPPKGSVVQVSLALPRQATEVDLRGKVMEILADGARLEIAPYSRETRMQLLRHMHLLEHAAGEVAFEMKQELGTDAMFALKALLPRASTRPVYSSEPKADQAPPAEAEQKDDDAGAAVAAGTGRPATRPVEEKHSIFRRRRMSRTVSSSGGHIDRVEPDHVVAEAPAAATSASEPAPEGTAGPEVADGDSSFVVPVLKGDVPDEPAPEYAVGDLGAAAPVEPAPAWATAPMPGSWQLPEGTEDFVEEGPQDDDPFADLASDLSDLAEPDAPTLSGEALDAIFGAETESSFDDEELPADDEWSVPEGAPWLQEDGASGTDDEADLEPESLDVEADEGAAGEPGAEHDASQTEADSATVPDDTAVDSAAVGSAAVDSAAVVSAAVATSAVDAEPEEAAPLFELDSRAAALVDDLDSFDGDLADAQSSGPGPVSSQGSLAEQPILAVFAALRSRTGVLTIKGETRTARIKLLKGKVCGVEEEPADPDTLFGQILLAMGFHKMPVMKAIDEAASSGKRIGDILLENGTAVPAMLKQAAVTQLKMRIGGLDGFGDGTYAFKEMVPKMDAGAARVGAVKVLFRGRLDWYVKRASRANQMEANQYADADVRRTSLGRRWVTKLGLALPQQGLWELVSTDSYKLADLKTRISFDASIADATLFTLRDLGCLEFRQKDKKQIAAAAAKKRIEDRYRRKPKTLFGVLDLHWTATDKVVEEAYQRFARAYDPGRLVDPEPRVLEKAKEIIARAEDAYATLKTAVKRTAYRDTVISEDERKVEAESQAKSADVALFKGEAMAAIQALAVSVELFHDPEVELRLEEAMTPDGLKRLMKQARQGEIEHQSSRSRLVTALDDGA